MVVLWEMTVEAFYGDTSALFRDIFRPHWHVLVV